jgi:hypothetical protein
LTSSGGSQVATSETVRGLSASGSPAAAPAVASARGLNSGGSPAAPAQDAPRGLTPSGNSPSAAPNTDPVRGLAPSGSPSAAPPIFGAVRGLLPAGISAQGMQASATVGALRSTDLAAANAAPQPINSDAGQAAALPGPFARGAVAMELAAANPDVTASSNEP